MHIFLPGYFNWKKELASLTLLNRQLMYVHMFFVAFVILLMGILCICCPADLMHTGLGRIISFGLFVFWGCRLVFQFLVYSPELWKGKLFETFIHVLFSMLWAYFSIVFFLVAINFQHV